MQAVERRRRFLWWQCPGVWLSGCVAEVLAFNYRAQLFLCQVCISIGPEWSGHSKSQLWRKLLWGLFLFFFFSIFLCSEFPLNEIRNLRMERVGKDVFCVRTLLLLLLLLLLLSLSLSLSLSVLLPQSPKSVKIQVIPYLKCVIYSMGNEVCMYNYTTKWLLWCLTIDIRSVPKMVMLWQQFTLMQFDCGVVFGVRMSTGEPWAQEKYMYFLLRNYCNAFLR